LSRLSLFLVSAAIVGCGGGGEAKRKPTLVDDRPSGKGVCAFLMQTEVDGIFGTQVGAGASESLAGGTELCSWPAGEDPALLVQIGPALPTATAAVDLGAGYRVVELSGMSGPAALAVETGQKETVAVVAMNVADKTVTLSPVGLGVEHGSPRMEKIKELVELVAQRSGLKAN
jgi:hypothetical protein